MAQQTFVRAYAQAAVAEAVEPWAKSLRTAAARLEKSADSPTLDDPGIPFSQKQGILNGLVPPDAPAGVRNFLYTLASRNHVALLPEVVAAFERMLTAGAERPLASVTSAVELTPAERGQVEERLRKQYGNELDIEYQVDPAIMGGIVLRVGDELIDGSVAGRLAALRTSLESAR